MGENRLCELLGIRYPIIQAPMNWVSGSELAAAVCNAGGLGTIGPNAGAKTIKEDVGVIGERLRSQIRNLRNNTKNPFAVNIAVGFGKSRRYSQKCVDIALEEKVPAAIVSVGSPNVYTNELKDAGVKVLHAVSTLKHAQRAEEEGVDAVICEGFEAGGHKGFTELTTFVLIPMLVDAIELPIVAGGGIADARGLLAALVLGAAGVYMGTRFMATYESDAHPAVKEAVIRGEDACTVSVPKETMLARDLRNLFTQEYLRMREAGAPIQELRKFINEHSQYHSQVLGDAKYSEICCGQVAGLIKEIENAEDIVKNIMKEMQFRYEEVKSKFNDF